MEKLRILHVIESLAVEGGGGDRACAELAEAQALNGHTVTVLCTLNPDRPTPIVLDGVSISTVRTTGWLGRKLGWNPEFKARLLQALVNVDIVHCHGTWRLLQVYVRRSCLALGIPYVQQPHGSFMPGHLRHRKWFKLVWGALFERHNLSGAAALHAETQADLEDIRLYQSHPHIYVLPCGSRQIPGTLEKAKFEELYPQLKGHRYVLYLGRVDFQKGVDLLIPAFGEVFAERKDALLVIVGPDYNDTKSALERLVLERGMENVRFLPAVIDDIEKKALFTHAVCFVLPSHSENFGITVLESLLAGCPVLVSRNTGWSSLQQDGGGLVFDPSPEGVRDALSRFLYMSDAELSAMVDRGRRIAAGYDWREIARRQDRVYADILHAQRNAR